MRDNASNSALGTNAEQLNQYQVQGCTFDSLRHPAADVKNTGGP